MSGFELFVARRYLRARRREKVISVITVISIAGVAAGVMALVISLAVNNGFRNTLQRDLLGATAHVNILEKQAGEGIGNWPGLVEKITRAPHVVAAAPVLYDVVLLSGPLSSKSAVLKGIIPSDELKTSDALRRLKSGSLKNLDDVNGLPGVILGSRLAQDLGMPLNSVLTVISPEGTLTPFGPEPRIQRFRVSGTFESGFFDFDDNWAYTSLGSVQKLLSVGNVVNSIEVRLDDLYLAPQVGDQLQKLAGPDYAAQNWEQQNRQLLNALKMERAVTAITIGLIELVAALNILITLTMVVLTKYKDIAVLMSMGATRAQIRRIFILQGVIIGAVGTALGLSVGYTLCYFADKYRWIRLDETVYALSFVPFEPRRWDGLWIAAVAIGVSLLATLYPARNATRITPVEVLRYE
jgi:lipoprotein-releasing system permease protein